LFEKRYGKTTKQSDCSDNYYCYCSVYLVNK
jgi:hypothetical protein